jgi:hypothetical protein
MERLNFIFFFVFILCEIGVVLDFYLNPFTNFLQILNLIKKLDIFIL